MKPHPNHAALVRMIDDMQAKLAALRTLVTHGERAPGFTETSRIAEGRALAEGVAAAWGVPAGQLFSRLRTARVVDARQAAVYALVRSALGATDAEAAGIMGLARCSVTQARIRAARRIARDSRFAARLRDVAVAGLVLADGATGGADSGAAGA